MGLDLWKNYSNIEHKQNFFRCWFLTKNIVINNHTSLLLWNIYQFKGIFIWYHASTIFGRRVASAPIRCRRSESHNYIMNMSQKVVKYARRGFSRQLSVERKKGEAAAEINNILYSELIFDEAVCGEFKNRYDLILKTTT